VDDLGPAPELDQALGEALAEEVAGLGVDRPAPALDLGQLLALPELARHGRRGHHGAEAAREARLGLVARLDLCEAGEHARQVVRAAAAARDGEQEPVRALGRAGHARPFYSMRWPS
jgi:hypothetical protein